LVHTIRWGLSLIADFLLSSMRISEQLLFSYYPAPGFQNGFFFSYYPAPGFQKGFFVLTILHQDFRKASLFLLSCTRISERLLFSYYPAPGFQNGFFFLTILHQDFRMVSFFLLSCTRISEDDFSYLILEIR